jgi:RNA polymerase sigma-70 factor (ECF subfamily)
MNLNSASPDTSTPGPPADQAAGHPSKQTFERQLVELRPDLMRFARLQLRHETWAEDAVSETLLAALSKPQSFHARSQLKTWLIGILKHKLIDELRQRRREVVLDNGAEDDRAAPLDHIPFTAKGHFANAPADWGNPEQALGSQQFMLVMDACIEKLPPVQARLFLMREWLDISSVEICKELNMTPTNLYVQLHRARLRLRECLELNWFAHP